METVPVRLICFPCADPAAWWLTYYPPGGTAGSAGFPILTRGLQGSADSRVWLCQNEARMEEERSCSVSFPFIFLILRVCLKTLDYSINRKRLLHGLGRRMISESVRFNHIWGLHLTCIFSWDFWLDCKSLFSLLWNTYENFNFYCWNSQFYGTPLSRNSNINNFW